MIYLDNAATSLRRPSCVGRAVLDAMQSFGNPGRSAGGSSLDAARTVFLARQALAELFGCEKASHVVFTANGTEALNMVLFGLLQPGDHVISTDLEHNSVLRPLYQLEKLGVEVDFCPADRKGNLDYGDFARLKKPNTRALVCTHGSNLTGNLLDLERIGAFAREHGLLFVVDAAQTAGVFPIDMGKMGIDVLCFTGHKGLMGPQGTGGLCLGSRAQIQPRKFGGTGVQTYLEEQPRELPTRLEAGTLNAHGIAGLLAAVEFIRETGLDAIRDHKLALARQFYDGVRKIEGVRVYGEFSSDFRAPVVALNVGELPSGEVSDILSEEFDIATRPGAHCAPRLHKALGTVEQGAVRFSFGYYNTMEEVDAAVEALRRIAQ